MQFRFKSLTIQFISIAPSVSKLKKIERASEATNARAKFVFNISINSQTAKDGRLECLTWTDHLQAKQISPLEAVPEERPAQHRPKKTKSPHP